jgi:hypothetical protein
METSIITILFELFVVTSLARPGPYLASLIVVVYLSFVCLTKSLPPFFSPLLIIKIVNFVEWMTIFYYASFPLRFQHPKLCYIKLGCIVNVITLQRLSFLHQINELQST